MRRRTGSGGEFSTNRLPLRVGWLRPFLLLLWRRCDALGRTDKSRHNGGEKRDVLLYYRQIVKKGKCHCADTLYHHPIADLSPTHSTVPCLRSLGLVWRAKQKNENIRTIVHDFSIGCVTLRAITMQRMKIHGFHGRASKLLFNDFVSHSHRLCQYVFYNCFEIERH